MRMRTRMGSALASSVLAAGALAPVADARPAPPARTGIPRLTDDGGRTLTLRGWNVEDKANRGDQALTAITEKHFRDLRAKGFDFARLLIFWDDLEPRRGHCGAAYLRRIDRILDWARKYGIHVLLDAHQDVFGPAFGHRGIPAKATRTDGPPFTPHPDDWFAEYFEPAVQRAFTHLYEDPDLRRTQARMWKVVADRYEHHPAVLGYDLINEPMGEIEGGEDLATAARRIEAQQLTPMYNRLARAVRSVDRTNWLFVEPTPVVGEGAGRASFAITSLGLADRRAAVEADLVTARRRGGLTRADTDALAGIGIDVAEIVARVEEAHGEGALDRTRRRGAGRRPFTRGSKDVLTKTLRIAVGRGDRFIGDEHLLLALTACPGVVADVLAAHGATYEAVNRALYGDGGGLGPSGG